VAHDSDLRGQPDRPGRDLAPPRGAQLGAHDAAGLRLDTPERILVNPEQQPATLVAILPTAHRRTHPTLEDHEWDAAELQGGGREAGDPAAGDPGRGRPCPRLGVCAERGVSDFAQVINELADILTAPDSWPGLGAESARRRRDRVGHVQTMTDRLSRAARLPAWIRDLVLPPVGPRTYRATYGPLRDPGF
jgi:hypothetical protein